MLNHLLISMSNGGSLLIIKIILVIIEFQAFLILHAFARVEKFYSQIFRVRSLVNHTSCLIARFTARAKFFVKIQIFSNKDFFRFLSISILNVHVKFVKNQAMITFYLKIMDKKQKLFKFLPNFSFKKKKTLISYASFVKV